MQAESKQKPNANQVICEKCGKWTDFANDRCPLCGAPLYGDEQPNDTEPDDDVKNDDQNRPKKDESPIERDRKESRAIILGMLIFYALLFLLAYITSD